MRRCGIIKELYPGGVPNQVTEPNVNLCQRVSVKLKEARLPNVSDDTILRAAGYRVTRSALVRPWEFISLNFLAPEEVAAKLERIDAADWISRWLKEPENVKLAARRLHGSLRPLLEFLREEQIRTFSRGVIRNGIDSIAAAPLAARVLSVLAAHGHHDAVFDFAIETAQKFLSDNRETFRQRVAKNSIYWLPNWVDAKLADAFLAALLDTLDGACAADGPVRLQYRAALNRLVTRLAKDPEMFDQAERLKADVLDNSVVDSYLDWLSTEIEERIKAEAAAPDGLFSSGLEHSLLTLGRWLESDEHIHAMINRWARQLVLSTVVPNRGEIGTFVAEVVAKWDTMTLVEKLELQVGRDLQSVSMEPWSAGSSD
ncbi:MAG TPA: DUF445 domain-containing protein [Methylocella sp.]|nr:DUF445 domain-containing protein [Methylocella sp.]